MGSCAFSLAFNQSQQFGGLFSISAPIGRNQAPNAILFCRKLQYFGIARLFENISGQPLGFYAIPAFHFMNYRVLLPIVTVFPSKQMFWGR